MTQTKQHRRSYSQVSQYRYCGWSFKLQRVDKVEGKPSWAAVAGSAVHNATEYIDRDWNPANSEDLIQAGVTQAYEYIAAEIDQQNISTDQWVSFGWKPRQDGTWWSETGVPNAIGAYVQWRLDNPRYVVIPEMIEVSFDVNVGDVWVVGKIDRVFRDREGGSLLTVDLKTGNKPKNDEQLGLYRQALAAQGVEVTYGAYLYGLKRGTAEMTPPLDLSHWTAEKLYRVYKATDQAADAGIFIPNPGDACRICSFADVCEFSRSAI